MINRRDWYLQQLGIVCWELRNPSVLRGEIAPVLPDGVRLLLVANAPLPVGEPLINDVLRTLRLVPEQVLTLGYEQATMLTQQCHCNSWWLGVDALPLPGVRLLSPELVVLHRSAAARAALWQQICEHEQDLLT